MPTSWRLYAVSALTTGWALACAGPALATPEEPAPPPPPPPAPFLPSLSGIGTALAQDGAAPAGPFGLPDLAAYGPNLLLGQNAVPSAPGEPAQILIPNITAFDPDYLLPQNTEPAAPGEGTPAPGIGPDADNPGTGRIAFLRRLYEMYRAGGLDGALLGQLPKDADGRPILPAEDTPDVG